MLDGYAADFELMGSAARLMIDTWSFGLMVADDAGRAQLLAKLRALPPDFFDAEE